MTSGKVPMLLAKTQRSKLELSVQGALKVAGHVFVIDVGYKSRSDICSGGDRTGCAVAQRGIDQSVAAHHYMEIFDVSGETDVLCGVGHVACGVLCTDDVSAPGQALPWWRAQRLHWSSACCCRPRSEERCLLRSCGRTAQLLAESGKRTSG